MTISEVWGLAFLLLVGGMLAAVIVCDVRRARRKAARAEKEKAV